MSVYRFICFCIIFHVVKSYCEHGSYISGISNTEKCCVNCKTIYFLNAYFESSCPDFPYKCKSDNGIFLEPGYLSAVDELSGFSTASIQCPSQVIVYSDKGVNSTSVLYNITNEGNIKDKSCTHPSGTSLQIGIHPVVCKAKNSDTENMLECNFTIYVIDIESPNLECPNVTVSTIPGKNFSSVTYEPVVWDNSGEGLAPKCNLTQGSTLPIGTHSVICDVSDSSWNNNSCSGSVIVEDIESPNLECPNVTVSTIPGKNFSSVTYEPVVWDNSGEGLEPKCNLTQGSTLPIGTHSVICDVSDSSWNNNSCSGSVIVEDNEVPYIECPNYNVSTIPGENYANYTYEPIFMDNSGEALETKCNLSQGSALPIGPYRVTCNVSDASFNVNNCSGNVLVEGNRGDKSKNNKIIGIVGVVVLVIVVAFAFILCYCRARQPRTRNTHEVYYHNPTGGCIVNMVKKLISVKNHGVSFADLSFDEEVSTGYTRAEISWNDKSGHVTKKIEKEDISRIMTVTDLTPNDDVKFTLTCHSNDGIPEHNNVHIKTHKNLSEIFSERKFDTTYSSVSVKLHYTEEHLTCESVWLVIKGVKCNENDNFCNKYNSDNHFFEQKIDAANGIIEYTFNDLKPGHQYQVFVELRTLNPQAAVKDHYDLGHVKTKNVSINDPEVSSSKVTVVFNNLGPDCKPLAFMCCGIQTIINNCITFNNLQQSTTYTLIYGTIYNGKHLYQGQRIIYTTPAEIERCPCATCEENIIEVFDKCFNEVNTLITRMMRGKKFVMRLAKALEFDGSIQALENESKLGNYKSMFHGLIENRKTDLDMNVDRFLKLFEVDSEQQDGFMTGDESESLITSDKEHLDTFYRLIAKAHKCEFCQWYFHYKIHDDTYIKNQLKYHQESM